MSPYRPESPGATNLDLGIWRATARPDVRVIITLDNRLFCWLVNQADHQPTSQYKVNMGNPALMVSLQPT